MNKDKRIEKTKVKVKLARTKRSQHAIGTQKLEFIKPNQVKLKWN